MVVLLFGLHNNKAFLEQLSNYITIEGRPHAMILYLWATVCYFLVYLTMFC
jgi:hypothetical protein